MVGRDAGEDGEEVGGVEEAVVVMVVVVGCEGELWRKVQRNGVAEKEVGRSWRR